MGHNGLRERWKINHKSVQKDNRKHATIEKQLEPCMLPSWRLGILRSALLPGPFPEDHGYKILHLEFKTCKCLQHARLILKKVSLILKEKIFHGVFSNTPPEFPGFSIGRKDSWIKNKNVPTKCFHSIYGNGQERGRWHSSLHSFHVYS